MVESTQARKERMMMDDVTLVMVSEEGRQMVAEWVALAINVISREALYSASGRSGDNCALFAREVVEVADRYGKLREGMAVEAAVMLVVAVSLAQLDRLNMDGRWN